MVLLSSCFTRSKCYYFNVFVSLRISYDVTFVGSAKMNHSGGRGGLKEVKVNLCGIPSACIAID